MVNTTLGKKSAGELFENTNFSQIIDISHKTKVDAFSKQEIEAIQFPVQLSESNFER